jgi:hypothetical protein
VSQPRLAHHWRRGRHGIESLGAVTVHVVPRSRAARTASATLSRPALPVTGTGRGARSRNSSPPIHLAAIKAQLRAPLKDAAAIDATRRALYALPRRRECFVRRTLHVYPLSVCNLQNARTRRCLCWRRRNAQFGWQVLTLAIKAAGRGSYGRTKFDKCSLPRDYCLRY